MSDQVFFDILKWSGAVIVIAFALLAAATIIGTIITTIIDYFEGW